MKPVIVALVGPTGVGKTRVAIRLCGELNAEIVSMDSMQVYRGMDIGTAKPTRSEREAARHHMVDIVDPTESFTVADYRLLAYAAIDDILSRDKLPLLVGGTGLYLNAVSYEMSLGIKGEDSELRDSLQHAALEKDGRERLYARLAELDPQSAAKLHPNDVRRVIRALEIYALSGREKSAQDDARREGPYRVLVYGLSLPREQLYARIDMRVDEMIRAGLVEEVQVLLARGVRTKREGGAMQAIGYKEVAAALNGEMPLDQAIILIKRNSRRYAKRQWTWFRHDPRVRWFDLTCFENEGALVEALQCAIREDITQVEF